MKKPSLRKTASQNETATNADAQPARDEQALLIPVSTIIVRQNPRSDLGDLSDLQASIAYRGILNPLLVTNTQSGVELLGGHRRLQCAKALGLEAVPCRIIDTNEPEIIKLLDNVMRESLSPKDECLALKRLLPAFDGNKSALARALSKSPSYVNRAVRAAELIEAGLFAGEQIADRQLSKSALFELAMASDPQAVLASAADGKKESIRQARAGASEKSGRKASGPIAGGRAVAQALCFRETKSGGFAIRVNFDPSRTPEAARIEMVKVLETLLAKLKAY
jgi:ParB family chromosome partitioning protein